jgi:ubiquinone/menaquinone biosynthesis C-methylase UbiE
MSALSLHLDTPDLAQHYERVSVDRQFKAGQLLIERLRVTAGEHVLDVGCGTGLLAEHVAGIVGPRGSVLGIDPLPLRIEIGKRKARSNLSFAVGDANQLDELAEASFDVVYLNAVFHWLPEKAGPLRQFLRVLRPGGRLGISTGSKDHVSLVQQIRRAVLSRYPYREYSESEAGFAHRVSQRELQELLQQAGYGPISVELVPHVQFQATAEEAVDFAQASSFGNFLSHLPDGLRQNARAEIIGELERSRTAEGIRQDSQRLVAIAHKPR